MEDFDKDASKAHCFIKRGIENLPNEIKLKISENLSLQDLHRMAKAISSWADIINSYLTKIIAKKITLTDSNIRSYITSILRYDQLCFSTTCQNLMSRFMIKHGCFINSLTISNCCLQYYQLLDTLSKADMLSQLVLENNVWLPEQCISMRRVTKVKSIVEVIYSKNKKLANIVSSQDILFLLKMFQNTSVFELKGRMILDFPPLSWTENLVWNVTTLNLECIGYASFKLLNAHILKFPNGRRLSIKDANILFLDHQLEIFGIIEKGLWSEIIFSTVQDGLLPFDWQIWNDAKFYYVKSIENNVYDFEDICFEIFPNLESFELYRGNLSLSYSQFVSQVTKLTICDMKHDVCARFVECNLFCNVVNLSLDKISGYAIMLPLICGHMKQLISLKMEGRKQKSWVEDTEITGVNQTSKLKIVKSDDWGSMFSYPTNIDWDNFGIRNLTNLEILIFEDTDHMLTDFSILYGISFLTQLKHLVMPNSLITDYGLSRIGRLPNLNYVDLMHCPLITKELCMSLMGRKKGLAIVYE